MNMTQNTILITGGSNGIGLAFAQRFLAAGNTVIICGRNAEKLKAAKASHPALHIKECDVGNAAEREALAVWLTKEFPELNVLVNNAGVQQRFNLLTTEQPWDYFQQEIAINLEAPLHLSLLLARRMAGKKNATIINVTSGLAFTPMASAPVYCATKAALHSLTISLRAQLASAGVKVVEVAPPAVNTDLAGSGLHTHGEPLAEFADGIMQGLAQGREEVGYGSSEARLRMTRDELDAATALINSRMPIPE